MFRKLHWKMTFFCTTVTGTILIFLTTLCLFIAERELQSSNYVSFLNTTNSILTQLQSNDEVSLQWINQLREKNNVTMFIYDNGSPLFSQNLFTPQLEISPNLLNETFSTAKEDYDIDILSPAYSKIPLHAEFTLKEKKGDSYYICAATLPKKNGTLSFLLFSSTRIGHAALIRQRLAFFGADAAGVVLLFLFFWFFTGKMLRPIEENNRRQIQFVAAASHELRTPLAVILSGLESLEKVSNEGSRRHFFAILQQECLSMQHLVSDMLTLSNFDAHSLKLHLAPCQPDELLLSVYEKYELLAQKKEISLRLELQPQEISSFILPDCFCDRERILQVLSILLDNALSYTPPKGIVRLSLLFSANTESGSPTSVVFQVSDSGPGISPEDRERIFERFYRSEHSRSAKEHFGLGLCIAKEIIDAHHGKISVSNSSKEGGACFSVTLKTT